MTGTASQATAQVTQVFLGRSDGGGADLRRQGRRHDLEPLGTRRSPP